LQTARFGIYCVCIHMFQQTRDTQQQLSGCSRGHFKTEPNLLINPDADRSDKHELGLFSIPGHFNRRMNSRPHW